MITPREGARLAHHSIRNSGLAQTPRGVDAGNIHIPCCDKAPHRAPAPTIPFANAGARLSGRTFRPDAFNRPQRGFDPRGAESVGTEVPPPARRTRPAARPASRVRASCAQPARPPWPPPGGGVPAATRAVLAHPRFRPPAVPGDAPCVAPPGASDRIGRVRLADVPCRARGPAPQALHRRGGRCLRCASLPPAALPPWASLTGSESLPCRVPLLSPKRFSHIENPQRRRRPARDGGNVAVEQRGLLVRTCRATGAASPRRTDSRTAAGRVSRPSARARVGFFRLRDARRCV